MEWNPHNLWDSVQRVIFQRQYSVCAVNFTNKIARSSWTWHNLWKLLIVNFRNKYFHNSVDWSGLFLQVYIHSWLAKVLRFTAFRLMENAFVKLPYPHHDLIISLSRRTVPQQTCPKQFVPICHEKLPSILYRARHYALAPLENHVEVYPSVLARKCRIRLANILKLAKRIIRQNKSVS